MNCLDENKDKSTNVLNENEQQLANEGNIITFELFEYQTNKLEIYTLKLVSYLTNFKEEITTCSYIGNAIHKKQVGDVVPFNIRGYRFKVKILNIEFSTAI